jgi:large repetitive protein
VDEDADLYGTEILNTASFAWGDISDSDTASLTIESSPVVPSPASLTISKSVTPDQKVALGGQVTYTIVLTNHGDTEAMNVVMTDILPVPLTVLSVQGGGTAAGNTVSWTGSILGNSSKTIVFTAALSSSPSLFGQTISNTVAFTSTNAGDGQTSVSFRVSDMPKVYLPVVRNP